MPATLGRLGSSARRTYENNSPAVEHLREAISEALPYGAEKTIASRLGRASAWIYDQMEGRHPLTVDVLLGCLLEMGTGPAIGPLADFLQPVGIVPTLPHVDDALAREIDEAREHLTGLIARLEARQ